MTKLRHSPVVDRLTSHIEALKKRGIAEAPADPSSALTRQGTLPIGPRAGNNLLADFTLTLADGRVAAALPETPNSTREAENALVLKAKAAGWTPVGSKARIIRKGTLNCHSGACDLVIHPK